MDAPGVVRRSIDPTTLPQAPAPAAHAGIPERSVFAIACPLLGPLPGTPGFWMAAGLSLNGFGGAGGIGKTIAEWMTAGETELDVTGYRAWRFGAAHRSPGRVEAAGREVYRYYYRLRYPLDTAEWGRPDRLSPLHGRLQDAGAAARARA